VALALDSLMPESEAAAEDPARERAVLIPAMRGTLGLGVPGLAGASLGVSVLLADGWVVHFRPSLPLYIQQQQ
jgi:hypothetical protein